MKLKVLATCLLVSLFSGVQAKTYEYKTVKGDLMHTRIYTLDNGLKVYLSVNKEKPRIQTFIAVRTGSRNDPAETTGLAHYLEHLMFKGTTHFGTSDLAKETPYLDEITRRYEKYRLLTDSVQRRKAYHEIDSISQLAARYNIPNEYDKLMTSIGSEGTNAFTSTDVTCYVEDIPSNEVNNWAKIQAERFRNMVIRGFHTELEAVYEEYNIGLANDGEKEWVAMSKKLFPTHPYGTQTTIGTQEHLKNPSIVNIKNYFNRYYVPNNIAICMAGDFNPDEVVATIDKYFGDWKPSSTLSRPEYAPQPDLTAPVDTTVMGIEAENVMLGWKFKGAADMQADTLSVIADMLSNGKAGLFDLNLNQPMKVLWTGAFYDGMTDYGMFILEGQPKQGQSLDDVRQLILAEIDNLKHGNFSDDLLPSVVNNFKLSYFQSLQNNRARTSKMMNAFINNEKWEDVVTRLDRMSKITKQQIVAFANKYLNNNYVCVYKRQGEDKTIKKIDKPQITAIPTNRDKSSQYLRDIKNSHVTPIQPQFLDYKRDLSFIKAKNNLPVIYKKNTDDGLFTLAYYFDFGSQADNRYDFAAEYINYLGTKNMTVEKLKQEFYKIACNYNISVNGDNLYIVLSGLNENMPKAVTLMEDLLKNAKVDRKAWDSYVDIVAKAREDNKKNQNANFSALRNYGMYGQYNSNLNTLSIEQLKKTDPQTMVDLMKGLTNYQHTVLYYGPSTEQQLLQMLAKQHKTANKLAAVPVNKPYMEQTTPRNEVLLAPYDAKNIYMTMYHNENKPWNAEEVPVATLFNEYFGGGMNTVVFQELRESRGLAYSASAYYQCTPRKHHPEYATTFIISQNDKMIDCIKVFNEILDTIPQSESAFQLAKQGLTKQLASGRTTRFGVINSYLRAKRMGIDYDINERIYNVLPKITLKDIIEFEKKTMADKPYRYIILGDEKNLDVKGLEKIAPIKRVSTEQIFGY